jgi:opacity protein-like surface antigen
VATGPADAWRRRVKKRSVGSFPVVLCVIALIFSLPASAEEVEKKIRVGLSLGQFNTRQSLASDAANIMTIVDANEQFVNYIEDPRNDNAALGELAIRKGTRLTATIQYAINRFFLVEGSAGYQKGDVGAIEMQAEFSGMEIKPIERHKYTVYNLSAGEMTQVPLEITAIARFRPKARFNPYLGAGLGYNLIGFTPSSDLNTLSARLDGLSGGQTRVSPYPATQPQAPSTIGPLSGAKVSADNTFEWHVVGGAEYSVKRKWTIYADLRYETASRSFFLGFNGSNGLGIAVPNRQAVQGSDYATGQYGPVLITNPYPSKGADTDPGWLAPDVGLVDGGLRVNPEIYEGQQVQTPGLCSIADISQCVFLRNVDMAAYNEKYKGVEGFVPVSPDGKLDPGYYYVNGGSIRYSGTSLQIGVRYTF